MSWGIFLFLGDLWLDLEGLIKVNIDYVGLINAHVFNPLLLSLMLIILELKIFPRCNI